MAKPGRWAWVGLGLLLAGPVQAEDARELFRAGVTAFRGEAYRWAVDYFERARDAGLQSPGLTYNLGVSYYRLGRLSKARTAFERLLDTEDEALAHYNLGLVAREQGRAEATRRHFRQARQDAEQTELRTLAAQALDEQTAHAEDGRPSGYIYASTASGYEDNVALAPDELVDDSETDDGFTEAFISASLPLAGSQDRWVGLTGELYVLDYWELDKFDLFSLEAGPEAHIRLAGWDLTAGASGGLIQLSWEDFERLASWELNAERPVTDRLGLELAYEGDRIFAQAPFEHLDGLRHRLTLSGRYRIGPGRIEAGYRLELNDRDDLRFTSQGLSIFSSFSPTRHLVFLETAWQWGPWATTVGGDYRFSRYDDPHRVGNQARTREDERFRFRVRASRALGNTFRVFLRYERTKNDSNLDRQLTDNFDFNYTSNSTALGLEAFF